MLLSKSRVDEVIQKIPKVKEHGPKKARVHRPISPIPEPKAKISDSDSESSPIAVLPMVMHKHKAAMNN